MIHLRRFSNLKLILCVSVILIGTTGCLKTRSQVSDIDQSMILRKKQAANQAAEAESKIKNKKIEDVVIQPDLEETARAQNGRIEVLENQVAQLQKEKNDLTIAANQRIVTLQDALTKMEAQVNQLEAEKAGQAAAAEIKKKSSDDNIKPSLPPASTTTSSLVGKKQNAFEIAEDLFDKKDYKKAILNYQKFIEDYPKSKSVPDAKYKTGVSFQELGLKDEALAFYEEVSVQYPQSAAGKKAKTRIAKLKKK